ncbi:EGF-like domain-containing protein 2 isoform X1 [Haliotis cracherodii]|uniref:EGF-like domain-containing protein 2 isoform X1 n=1 Tax=Haliotis cracherodii TaxID=6455 RepID=UPI0039E81B2A
MWTTAMASGASLCVLLCLIGKTHGVLTISPSTLPENAGIATIAVTTSLGPPSLWLFLYETLNGTAVAGTDFTLVQSGTASPYVTSLETITIDIEIKDDSFYDPGETFTLFISHVSAPGEKPINITISIIDNEDPVSYHCARLGQNCSQGICDPDTGVCACPPDYQSADCSINSSSLVSSGCPGCVNGTCIVNDNGDEVCRCQPGHAGAMCDKPAYYHECSAESFSVCITPFPIYNFVGDVYVMGKRNVSGCNLTIAPAAPDPGDGIVDWCQGYGASIPYDGTCGALINDDGSQFVLKLVVQYSDVPEPRDEEVVLTCDGGLGPPGSVQVFTANYVPGRLYLVKPNHNPITEPLNLGEDFVGCVTVSDVKAFDVVLIHRVVIHNNQLGTSREEMVIYVDGCVPQKAKTLLVTGPQWTADSGKQTMCFRVETFYFDSYDVSQSSPSLGVTAHVSVHARDTGINVLTCGGRRKRMLESFDEEVLNAVVYLANRDTNVTESPPTASNDSRNWLVSALICVGAVAVVMTVIVVVFTVSYVRRHFGKNTK